MPIKPENNNQKIGKIYKMTNLVNGKIYIGQTWGSIKERYSKHKHEKGCRLLYRAIKKHGLNNFSYEQINKSDNQEELDKLEIKYILEYQSQNTNIGYNIKNGGEGGGKLPLEIYKIIGKKLKERYDKNPELREEVRRKSLIQWEDENMRNLARERAIKQFFDPIQKEKLRISHKKQFETTESRRKMSISKGGNPFWAEKEEIVLKFFTQTEASNILGCDRRKVNAILMGRRKRTKGWTFYY